MAFEKGHKLATGRPPGSVNQTTKMFHERLAARGFNAADALLDIYELGLDTFHNGHPDDRMIGLKIAADAAKDMVAYIMPKLKSIEVTSSNQFANMSDKEKLEALKKAIPVLENKIKQEVEGSNHSE